MELSCAVSRHRDLDAQPRFNMATNLADEALSPHNNHCAPLIKAFNGLRNNSSLEEKAVALRCFGEG